MRKQWYLKEKKRLKREIKVFEKHIDYNCSILTPIAAVYLNCAKKTLKELNLKYNVSKRRNKNE